MEVPVCLAPENSRMPESEVAVAEALDRLGSPARQVVEEMEAPVF